MKYRSHPPIRRNSHSIHRLRTPMRPNIILGCYSNHKPIISYPLHRHNPSRVNLRRLFSRQSHPHTILCLPLHPALHHHCPSTSPSTVPTRNRIQQPNWAKLRYRQNPISPLLHNQRLPRYPHPINSFHNFGFIFPRYSRRP